MKKESPATPRMPNHINHGKAGKRAEDKPVKAPGKPDAKTERSE